MFFSLTGVAWSIRHVRQLYIVHATFKDINYTTQLSSFKKPIKCDKWAVLDIPVETA